MPTYTGGTRARLVKDNVYNWLESSLDELGWLTSVSSRRDVVLLSGPNPWDEEIQPNCVAISTEGVDDFEIEIGSTLSNHTWEYYIDVIGENDSLALHLATDIRDSIQGRITELTYPGPLVTVYDLTISTSTPVELFTVELMNVQMDKGRTTNSSIKRYWWQIAFDVVDYYE